MVLEECIHSDLVAASVDEAEDVLLVQGWDGTCSVLYLLIACFLKGELVASFYFKGLEGAPKSPCSSLFTSLIHCRVC